MAEPARPIPVLKFQFGPFVVDAAAGELRKHGVRMKIQERPLRLLLALLEKPGELVSREELRQRIWPDGTFVDFDHNISSCVNKLRGALNDTARSPRYIETVGSRGYRFVATCQPLPEFDHPEQEATAVPQSTPSAESSLRSNKWLIAVALLAVLMIAATAYFLWSRARNQAATAKSRPVLAVLPFANLTGDAGQEYFSDGLTEEMISRIGQLDPQHMGVIARTSVMHYKNSTDRLDKIASELGANYVLEGSVRRGSGSVRVTAELIQVSNQERLWARDFTHQESDILLLQDEITRDIADEIHQILGLSSTPSIHSAQHAQNYEAHELYLKGRYSAAKRTSQGLHQSVEFFEQAIAKDPTDARSFAALADSYSLMSSYYQGSPAEYMTKAKAAALKAVELDDNLAEAHTSLALIAQNYDWDWKTAEQQYLRAIALDPNYATAHHWYAELLAIRGRFNEAFPEIERARRLDPVSLIVAADYAVFLHYSRQYDRAIQQFRTVLEMDPTFPRVQIVVSAYCEKGMYKEAFAQLEQWRKVDDSAWRWATVAYVDSRSGQTAQVQDALSHVERMNANSRVGPAPLILAYVAAGQREKAVDQVERAYAEHSPVITAIGVDPVYDSLRGEPRFQALLKKLDLPNGK
jgi:TolB-like protein/DNA-binding winged helix-turn-helix (wHTH) protein/Tfp pilus assembly protein PilF